MNASDPNPAESERSETWTPLLKLASREVFELMLSSPLGVPPEVLTDQVLDITAMVGLAGQVCGIMTLRCTSQSAALMASKMLGVDVADTGPEMWDAVGEVCNMIAGNFKNKVTGMGDTCMLSVPTVITGADYSLHAPADSGKIQITLLFEESPLIISLEVND